jgi:PPK2 family polyphosphate:nucleotide phosphotransferase
MNSARLITRYRIADAEKFRLGDFSPADRGGLGLDKQSAKEVLAKDIERLSELQQRLYAQDRWSLLIVLQAMDAAGKDSLIKHVMSGINPQGCHVTAFKAPSAEELDHDFLWRAARALPERGRIGIFNRSYYEEVLVARVHREILEKEKLPPKLVGNRIWQERFKDIRAFERHLARNGTVVLKFFLYVSKEEQRKRFLARLDEPAKQWKFSMADVEERKLWDRYMTAYEEMIRHTSTAEAPWHVVPADHKWFTHLVAAATIVAALDRLDLKFPKVKGDARKEIKVVKKALQAEAPGELRPQREDGEKEERRAKRKPRPKARKAKGKKVKKAKRRAVKRSSQQQRRARKQRVERRLASKRTKTTRRQPARKRVSKLSRRRPLPRRAQRRIPRRRRRLSGNRARSARARAAPARRPRARRRKPPAGRRQARN